VENCVFQNNESAGSYGGAAIGKHYDGSLTIVSSKFLNNNASCANCSGGAIEITDGTQTLNVSNSIFADNVAKKYGGAISTGAAATTSLLNNTFLNNTAFFVGGAYNAGGTSSANLESNTFVGNLAITNGGGIFIENTSTEFKNNVFHSNFSTQTASTLEDCYKTGASLTSVGGNISDGTLCNVTAGPGDTFDSTDLYSDSSVSHLADFFSLYLQIFSGSASRGHGLSCSSLDGLNTSRGATCDAGSTQYISTSRPLDIEYKFSKLTLPFTQPAVAIRPFSPVVQGGSATSFSISPSLPAGLDFNLSNGTISGTPVYSLTSPMRFTVTASNTFGSASTILTIDIKEGFFVDTNNDLSDGSIGDGRCQTANNKCSLRAAIEESNTSGSPRLIFLPNGHYSLDSNLPIISFNLTLIGETKLATIIDGKSAHKIFNVGASASKRDFVFQNLTLKDSVGALSFSGSNVIEIQNVYIQNNVSTGAGAGLFIDGNESNYINIENSRFEGNLSDSGGGALSGNSTYHTLSISKSTFKGNHCQNSSCDGGAIGGFKLKRITHSLFENNSSTDKGGAIFWVGETNGVIINTSFYKNQSKYGGAI
ncbi:MAG: putative Ig domain-containing protein, partial [Bdellovibrionales bacterium]|nr:putative Ig domain-containing protein [Bdellovibrionales bacterium]